MVALLSTLLLENSRTCEAPDPRDKLFVLLGLATGTQSQAEDPDYSISLDEAYMKFANALIEAERNLNILGHCQATVRNSQSWSSFRLLPPSLVPKRPPPPKIPD